MVENIMALVNYWEAQSIQVSSISKNDIEIWQLNRGIILPYDFMQYFLIVNGMKFVYPDGFDKEGFLFYPIEGLITVDEEFSNQIQHKNKIQNILIFAEYMHKSWWYGVRKISNENYEIGIIPHEKSFKIITNSLDEFLKLYLINSPILYSY